MKSFLGNFIDIWRLFTGHTACCYLSAVAVKAKPYVNVVGAEFCEDLKCSPMGNNIKALAENNHHRGMYLCTADLLFDLFAFDQTSETVVHAIYASKAAKSKRNKQVSRTVTLPLTK